MILPSRISLVILLFASAYCAAQNVTPQADNKGSEPAVNTSSLYLKVRLDSPLKVSKLRPGDQVSGKLLQDVYWGTYQDFLPRVRFASAWIGSTAVAVPLTITGRG